ncbi:MAG: glycosyltransferase family 4 protein [Calditrichaeota bacterium]|nr:glycosyltransferase family 4 protein [Calditrichota bacterium]
MNVLVITDFFPHRFRDHDGIFVREQVQELAKKNRILVITPRVWYPPLKRYRALRFPVRKVPFKEIKKDWTIYRPLFRNLPVVGEFVVPFWFFLKLLVLIAVADFSVDVIHAHWAYRSGWWAILLGKLLRKPVVITSHGSDIHSWMSEPVKKGRIRRALSQASGVIFVSRKLADIVAAAGIRLKKSAIIPNGIAPVTADLKSAAPRVGSSAKNMVFVGNLFRVKGADRLVEALKLLKQRDVSWHVDLIGDGPERQALENRVKALKLDRSVKFWGKLSHSAVLEKLSLADVLVIPSRREGGPLVLIEALALGKTVVAFDVGNVTDVLDRPELGYVVKEQTAEALAAAIDRALRMPVRPELARQRASEFFLTNLVPKIDAFYQAVV